MLGSVLRKATMTAFEDAYYRSSRDFAGVSGALHSAEFVSEVQAAIDKAVEALAQEATRRANVAVDYVKGNLAEVWHAETLNVSAVVNSQDNVWAQAMGTNRPGQDVTYGDGLSTSCAELKYYKNGEATAKQFANPNYSDSQKIAPSDQLAEVINEANSEAIRNQDIRPEVAAAYQHTADTVSDHIEVGEASSKPLSEVDAKGIATDLKQDGSIDPDAYGLNTESFVEWSDIFRESGSAALNAAAFSAAFTAAPHIYRIISRCIASGELDTALVRQCAGQVLASSSAAGLRGGLAAVITGSCQAGLMGNLLKGISPSAVGMATAMALNSIENSWRYAQGRLSGREMAFNSSRDAVALMMGAGGAALGQLIIPIPMLGALIGNLVGSTLGSLGVTHANDKVLGICVESGWTFWGLVEQSYAVPEDVLQAAGFDLFARQTFATTSFGMASFNAQPFKTAGMELTLLRRGVVGFNAVGYC
jgi:hypothetical protein